MAESTYGDSRSERAHRAIELAWRTSRGRHPDVSLLTGGVLFFGTYGDSRSERAHRAIELAWRPRVGDSAAEATESSLLDEAALTESTYGDSRSLKMRQRLQAGMADFAWTTPRRELAHRRGSVFRDMAIPALILSSSRSSRHTAFMTSSPSPFIRLFPQNTVSPCRDCPQRRSLPEWSV